jgi:hypothetical protein
MRENKSENYNLKVEKVKNFQRNYLDLKVKIFEKSRRPSSKKSSALSRKYEYENENLEKNLTLSR